MFARTKKFVLYWYRFFFPFLESQFWLCYVYMWPMQTSYSYLDVVGRTTVVLKKKNVVGDHNVPFQVLCSVPQIGLFYRVLSLPILSSFLWTAGVLWIQSSLHAGGTIDADICAAALLCRLHRLPSHGSFHREIAGLLKYKLSWIYEGILMRSLVLLTIMHDDPTRGVLVLEFCTCVEQPWSL